MNLLSKMKLLSTLMKLDRIFDTCSCALFKMAVWPGEAKSKMRLLSTLEPSSEVSKELPK